MGNTIVDFGGEKIPAEIAVELILVFYVRDDLEGPRFFAAGRLCRMFFRIDGAGGLYFLKDIASQMIKK